LKEKTTLPSKLETTYQLANASDRLENRIFTQRELRYPQSSKPRINLTVDASDRLEDRISAKNRLQCPRTVDSSIGHVHIYTLNLDLDHTPDLNTTLDLDLIPTLSTTLVLPSYLPSHLPLYLQPWN